MLRVMGQTFLLAQRERDGFILRRGVKELYAQTGGLVKEMIFAFVLE